MTTVRVTRRVHFSAAHRLHNPEWSEERNAEVFGEDAGANFHGHNYELEVTVEGPIRRDTGYVVDLAWLKELIQERVVNELDHRNLNLDVPWLQGVQPSMENLVVEIWERLKGHLPEGVGLARLLLRETPRNWVEYEGGTEAML
ncbi:MAG: 6-pyruvoyl tetrahydropterin synthase family protein [Gemmatimonadota bacterium]